MNASKLFLSVGLGVLLLSGGCERGREPFVEAKALVCPANTFKAEATNSSYPEYYCVGSDGKEGPWLDFDINGRIRTRTTYVHDRMHGLWTQYHPDGSIAMQGEMVHGKREGLWTQYFISGKVRSEKIFEDDAQNGPIKLYYESGQLLAQGTFVHDLEQGKWRVYTPKGELARECEMVDGQEKNCEIHVRDFVARHLGGAHE